MATSRRQQGGNVGNRAVGPQRGAKPARGGARTPQSPVRTVLPVDPTPVRVQVRSAALGGRFVAHPVAMPHEDGVAAEPGPAPTWFVSGAIDGEIVIAKRTRVRKGIVEGRTLEVISPAQDRTVPPCEYADACGGCSWQHISASGQASRKRALCEQSLATMGLELTRWRDAPATLGYRRRARFHYERRGELFVLGVRPEQSHTVVDVRRCVVLDPALDRAVQAVRALAPLLPKRGEIHALSHGGEVILGLTGVRTYDQLLKEARALINSELVGITFRMDRVRKVVARGWLAIDESSAPASAVDVGSGGQAARSESRESASPSATGGGPSAGQQGRPGIRCGPFAFAQANAALSRLLVDDTAELCTKTAKAGGAVVELFAGSGNLTRALWQGGRTLYAVEQDRDASASLAELVRREGAAVQCITGDAGRALHHLWEDGVAVSTVVLDPPRTGLDQTLIDDLITMRPAQIVLVSCDFMTLRRDLGLLTAAGYEVTHATGYDTMPMTAQMELLIELRQRAGRR